VKLHSLILNILAKRVIVKRLESGIGRQSRARSWGRCWLEPRQAGQLSSTVIASEAKQSILSSLGEDGLLRFARNDVVAI
jgi:hypothetical protein